MLVGTKAIVEKYQKLIYKEEESVSESSEESFQFSLSEAGLKKFEMKKRREARLAQGKENLTAIEKV